MIDPWMHMIDFTHPNKNIHSSEIVLIFSYFILFLQIFSSLATVFKADVQCVRRYNIPTFIEGMTLY